LLRPPCPPAHLPGSLPIALSARHDEPLLEALAREVFALFPRCLRCGQPIVRYEDADVRVFANRVTHREGCGAEGAEPAGE